MSFWEEIGRRHGLKMEAGFLLGNCAPISCIEQLPTAILRSDGARRAFPRHLPSLKNSESMSAWIGVICRSSAKSN
jgi:hypothetical protein